jgi:outer membrane protein
MKKLIKSTLLIFILAVASISTVTAQKYGHLNSGNLIMSIPEAQSAEKELAIYRDQLIAALKKKGEALQAEGLKLQQEYDAGTLSQIKAQEKQNALMKRGQELRQEEIDIGEKVAKKREELLKPILDKIDAALKEIGKEGGYTMIFDTGIFNALLYVQESDDLMPLIKAKLGL